jgi:hypothetical protein
MRVAAVVAAVAEQPARPSIPRLPSRAVPAATIILALAAVRAAHLIRLLVLRAARGAGVAAVTAGLHPVRLAEMVVRAPIGIARTDQAVRAVAAAMGKMLVAVACMAGVVDRVALTAARQDMAVPEPMES